MRLLRSRLRSEQGFSFLELLIAIIVLGVLAAIVLPFFTGQGDDASAKSNANEVARALEECGAETNDYSRCANQSELDIEGLPWGPGRGEVAVSRSARRESR